MEEKIKCIPFALNWTEERMSLKVDIMCEVAYSDHIRLMGEASVVIAKEMTGEHVFSEEYITKLIYSKLEWFESHEGFEVTKNDLEKICTEIAEKIWDE